MRQTFLYTQDHLSNKIKAALSTHFCELFEQRVAVFSMKVDHIKPFTNIPLVGISIVEHAYLDRGISQLFEDAGQVLIGILAKKNVGWKYHAGIRGIFPG